MSYQPLSVSTEREEAIKPAPMRILQVATYLRPGGGIQTHILDLNAWMRMRGHQVFLAGCGEPGGFLAAEHFTPLPLDRVSAFEGTGGFLALPKRLVATLGAVMSLRGLIRRERIDIVHVHETAPLVIAWLSTRGLSIPVIQTYHGAASERLAQLAGHARRMADLVISPSRTSLAILVSAGVPAQKARQLGLPVKPFPAPDPQRVAKLRAALLGEGGKVLVLSLARYSEQKGLDAMIRVAKAAARRSPGLRIAVGGRGPLEADLRRMARDEGVEDVIRFIGLVEDAALYLAAADIFLLTSRWEELPISIVEALRAGVPVIATDCGGVRELVDDEIGRLCAVDDEPALTDALVELCEDPHLRIGLGARARERSREDRFSAGHVYRAYEGLYQDFIARRPRLRAGAGRASDFVPKQD